MTQKIKGQCLCGGVTLVAQLSNSCFDVCHCGMCRRWGGGPAFSVDVEDVSFGGEDNIQTYESSEWAERGFCKRCGTHLFYNLKNTKYSNVSLGLLGDVEGLEFHSQIFIDSKPSHYSFANRTETMTEAEVLAKFGVPPAS